MQSELGPHLPDGRMLFDKTAHQLMKSLTDYLDVEGVGNIGTTHKTFREDMLGRKNILGALVDDRWIQAMFDQYQQ